MNMDNEVPCQINMNEKVVNDAINFNAVLDKFTFLDNNIIVGL